MGYDDEGIPIGPTCEKNAEECDCWDNDDVHEIIAFRTDNGLYESEHLQLKIEEEDDEKDESEETEESEPEPKA